MGGKLKTAVLLIFVFIFSVCIKTDFNTKNVFMPLEKYKIVIDAGHGGWDPGKTGTNGDDEKDINLSISKKLVMLLENGGAVVSIVRNEDEALGKSKKEDMRERKEIINSSNADICISIHQNSFPLKNAKGAQVFYYGKSEEGKILAACIQNKLKEIVDNENNRVEKSNESYYILKKIDIPAVIVECGFLSNSEEEKKLNSDDFQSYTAWAIYCGIVDYFDKKNSL